MATGPPVLDGEESCQHTASFPSHLPIVHTMGISVYCFIILLVNLYLAITIVALHVFICTSSISSLWDVMLLVSSHPLMVKITHLWTLEAFIDCIALCQYELFIIITEVFVLLRTNVLLFVFLIVQPCGLFIQIRLVLWYIPYSLTFVNMRRFC